MKTRHNNAPIYKRHLNLFSFVSFWRRILIDCLLVSSCVWLSFGVIVLWYNGSLWDLLEKHFRKESNDNRIGPVTRSKQAAQASLFECRGIGGSARSAGGRLVRYPRNTAIVFFFFSLACYFGVEGYWGAFFSTVVDRTCRLFDRLSWLPQGSSVYRDWLQSSSSSQLHVIY